MSDNNYNRELELTALICSKLCHDLVSPIGAISAGMEILAEETDANMREQVTRIN
jgi:histidine phosphotransferase ChpT